jgi:hypothetical protein
VAGRLQKEDLTMKLEPELADALGQAGGGANNGADASADNHRSEKEEKEQRTQAGILIKLAKRFGLSLFRTPDADGYADIKVKGHRETWPLRSRGFRKWLRQIYFFEEKSAPNKEALESAVETLDAEAQFSCETTHPVELRVAYHDGKIYYDLCDDRWEVVEITASDWKIVTDAPVRFRRTSTSRPQVTPVKGGKLGDLRSFLNLKNNKSWILLVSAMLKYFYEPGGHPIIELCGEHGTAKTTTERIISRLVDPSAAPARCPPGDERDLTAAAYGGYVLAYDNLSSLPLWLSDALCRLATGAGLSGRTLYTNTDETIVEAKRPLILTGINPLALRGDIADRANKIFLEKIEQSARKDEASFWRDFETALPKLVGAIMDALVIGLRNLPKTKPANLPRMADYAIWGTACESAYTEPGNLMRALALASMESVEDVIEASVAAQILREHLTTKVSNTEWKTTANALYAALKATANEIGVAKSDRWPADGQRLIRELTNVAPALREVGIEIKRGKRRKGDRPFIITHPGMGKTASPGSPASPDSEFNDLEGDAGSVDCHPASPRASPRNPLGSNGNDSGDAGDAEFPTQGCRDVPPCGDDGLGIPDFLDRNLPSGRRPALGPEGDSLDDFR